MREGGVIARTPEDVESCEVRVSACHPRYEVLALLRLNARDSRGGGRNGVRLYRLGYGRQPRLVVTFVKSRYGVVDPAVEVI